MLISNCRQSGKMHEVFVAAVRVVDSRVASVDGEVFHCLGDRGGVSVGDRLRQHIVVAAQGTHEGHALRCAERQIKPVHPALPECTPLSAVRSYAVVKPVSHDLRVSLTASTLDIGQAHRLRNSVAFAHQ